MKDKKNEQGVESTEKNGTSTPLPTILLNATPSIITAAAGNSLLKAVRDKVCMGAAASPGAAAFTAAVMTQARAGVLRGATGITTKRHLDDGASSAHQENNGQAVKTAPSMGAITFVAAIDTVVTNGFDTKAVCKLKGDLIDSSRNNPTMAARIEQVRNQAKTHGSAIKRLYAPKLAGAAVGTACFLEASPAIAKRMADARNGEPTLGDHAKAGAVTGGAYGAMMSPYNAIVDSAMFKTEAIRNPDGSITFRGPSVLDGLKNSTTLKATVLEALSPKKLAMRTAASAAMMATLQTAVHMYGPEPVTEGLSQRIQEFPQNHPRLTSFAGSFFNRQCPSGDADQGPRDLPQNGCDF